MYVNMYKTLISLSVAIIIVLSHNVVAQAEGCNEVTGSSFRSSFYLPANVYRVYGQINNTNTQLTSRLIQESLPDDGCKLIGERALSTESWTELGIIESSKELNTIYLNIDNQTPTENLTKPIVIFIPANFEECKNPDDCPIIVDENVYTFVPEAVSPTFDTLSVGLINQTADLSVDRIEFYKNKVPLYTSDVTEIDERYLSYGEYEISEKIHFSNGQTIQRSYNVDVQMDIYHWIMPYIITNQNFLKSVGYLIGLLLLYWIFYILAFRYKEKRKWLKNHNALRTRNEKQINSVASYEIEAEKGRKKVLYRRGGIAIIMPVVLLIFYISVDTWVIGVLQVDGVSMETTLKDGDRYFIDKIPITTAKIQNNLYLPKRGEVVVFKKNERTELDNSLMYKDKYVVKRVLGLPGEIVSLINGELVITSIDSTVVYPDKDKPWSSVLEPTAGPDFSITLGNGELFVAGDNRIESIDSRFYGPINSSQVYGVVNYSENKEDTTTKRTADK